MIDSLGDSQSIIVRGKRLYRLVKKCIEKDCREARHIVKDVEGGNVWEAWRLLGAGFDPRNDLSNANTMRTLMSEKVWKGSTITEVPQKVSTWERMQREFRARTGEEALSSWSKRQIMLSMLPPQVQEYINVRSHYGQELNYQQIKAATLALVQRTNPTMPTPMDCSVFSPSPEEPRGQPSSEPVDAFGQNPRVSPLGKGGSGGDPTLSNNHADKTCDICGRKGHIKKDCWFRAGGEKGPDKMPRAKKGAGKGAGGKGDRQRGQDGRWYKTSGINSWELDEDQENGEQRCSVGSVVAIGDDDDDGYFGINSFEAVKEYAHTIGSRCPPVEGVTNVTPTRAAEGECDCPPAEGATFMCDSHVDSRGVEGAGDSYTYDTISMFTPARLFPADGAEENEDEGKDEEEDEAWRSWLQIWCGCRWMPG